MQNWPPFPSPACRLSLAGVPALAVALTGCAILPHTGPLTPLAPPSSYASQKSFAAPGASWPSDRWWKAYQDPQLTSLIEEGLATAPDMQAAALQTAEGRYRGGLGTYLDVLTAEDSLIAAQRQVADLETSGFTTDVSLIRALGGGFRS